MDAYVGGCMSSGSYFTYKGVRYGEYTNVRFKKEVYERIGKVPNRKYTTFYWIKEKNGKNVWGCGQWLHIFERHEDIVPDRDIEAIITPVYYYTPWELVKKRFKDGTWFGYIWSQTLIFALCLLFSPLLKQWYLIWTMGLYMYLRLCYIELSRGELDRGW